MLRFALIGLCALGISATGAHAQTLRNEAKVVLPLDHVIKKQGTEITPPPRPSPSPTPKCRGGPFCEGGVTFKTLQPQYDLNLMPLQRQYDLKLTPLDKMAPVVYPKRIIE